MTDIISLGKKEARWIVVVLLGCFIVGFAISYGYIKLALRKRFAPKATITKPAIVTLSSDKKTLKVGDKFLVTIEVDSQDQGVEAADFVVNFNPLYLRPIKISEGNFFKLYPVKKVEKDFIKISGMASLENDTILIPKGKGVLATIIFQAEKATKAAKISFDQEKTVVASKGVDILGKVNEVKMKIN